VDYQLPIISGYSQLIRKIKAAQNKKFCNTLYSHQTCLWNAATSV